MSSLNINTLFEEMDQKVLNRLKMFDDILVQIHTKIKISSKNKTFFCTHQIPEFLIGKPIYKIEDLRKYLINSLKKNGFQIIYIDPNWIFISWDMKPKKTTIKKIKKKEENDFKLIDEYKPSGNLIYSENELLMMKEKINHIS